MAGEDDYYLDNYYSKSPETAYISGFTVCNDGNLKSYEDMHQASTKAEYKHYGGGGCSGKVTKTIKTGGSVDGRNGNHVYKREVDYDSSFKVSDQRLGITTQYETQIKHKQTTTYSNPSSKSLGGGGKSCAKSGYSIAKPSKSSGAVQFKNTGGTGKVTGSIVAKYSHSSGGAGKGSASRGSNKKGYY